MDSLPLSVLLVEGDIDPESSSGNALTRVEKSLEDLQVRVKFTSSPADAGQWVGADTSLGAVIASAADPEGSTTKASIKQAAELIDEIRDKNLKLPVFLMSGRRGPEDLPTSVLREVTQFVYLLDDTPDWIAGRIRDAALRYRKEILPPMFEALTRFAQTHEYSWHTPGHEGGAAFLKSPVGRVFWTFFGEQTFRSDLSISVGELGSLLDHSGPIGEAERRAAEIFGADMTFFVTNGTSTSNRVLHQASVTAGDVMLLDRNAHKSMEQASTITHGVPVYMIPTRNHLGIIGPVPPSEMNKRAVNRKLKDSPLVEEGEGGEPVIAMVTNSTYDGLLYHVPTVETTLGTHVDRLHFDEAWYGYAAFNPIYEERHAMHQAKRKQDAPTTFATQSTHKLLAALSQASYVHIRNGRNPVDHDQFNEAFMMHASTSPLYAIIASNDVAAGMMAGRGGHLLTRDSITEAVAFRRTLSRVASEAGSGDWAIRPWQPESVTGPRGGRKRFEDAPEDHLINSPDPWLLREKDSWHGFEGLPDEYAMLDPIKVTTVTPGVAQNGSLEDFGVPAALLTAYLDQQESIVVEKTQDYSILFLFSIGVTRGKWGSLLATMMAFKRDVDANVPLERALPGTVAGAPRRYAGMGLRDLAEEMHGTIRDNRQLDLLQDAFGSQPVPEMIPAEAYAHVVRGTIDPVQIDDLEGRTVAVGLVPYPPGIPLMMPGENSGPTDGPFVAYLRALQDFDRKFPGFEHDIHGIDHIDGAYVTRCVRDQK